MKSIALFSFGFLFVFAVSAQDSINIRNLRQMQVGVYKTQKSFFARKADIEKPVRAVVNIIKDKKSDSSIAYGYTYGFVDSTKPDMKVFAFFDGQNVYIQTEKNVFFKLDGFGRHPYGYLREIEYGTYLPMGTSLSGIGYDLPAAGFSLLFNAIRKRKICLHYFNRRRQLMKATPEGVGFLLKKDKDLFEAYGNEPQKTEAVMLKYLNKMNERYPTWEVK
ncbi:MAG TPA: hypothetical protein PLY34_06475 [Ferruginibacter sp.]|nr:hypothetical protein [Ferruginibacter sp.]HPH92776.1 hypothetical protein [Ferruginibacter sp.]